MSFREPRSRGRWRWVVAVPVAVALLLGATFAVASAVATRKVRQVRRGWETSLGSWSDVMARFPPRKADADAREMERLAAALGIDLAPRASEGRERPTEQDAKRFADVKKALGRHLTSQLERPIRRLDPPPNEVAYFLDHHRPTLNEMRRQLLHGGIPTWESRLDRLAAAPLPNLLGHLDLQKVLLLDALEHARRGDRDAALEGLEASWRLSASLRNDPMLITQLVAVAIVRQEAGAIRQIDGAADPWLRRLSELDVRGSLHDALRFEGWMWTYFDQAEEFDEHEGLWRKVFWSSMRPYLRYGLAQASDAYRQRLEQVTEIDAICDRDLRGTDAALTAPVPRWNIVGRIIMPDYSDVVSRLSRLQIDLELTAAVIRAEATRAANDGRWPDEMPEIEGSSACPEQRWRYTAAPDGKVTIALDRELRWPGHKGTILPTRFTLGP